MNHVCCGSIRSQLWGLKHVERILAINLYTIINIVSGLQSLSLRLSAFLGMAFITPVVVLCGKTPVVQKCMTMARQSAWMKLNDAKRTSEVSPSKPRDFPFGSANIVFLSSSLVGICYISSCCASVTRTIVCWSSSSWGSKTSTLSLAVQKVCCRTLKLPWGSPLHLQYKYHHPLVACALTPTAVFPWGGQRKVSWAHLRCLATLLVQSNVSNWPPWAVLLVSACGVPGILLSERE